MHNERCRGQWPRRHDQVPATRTAIGAAGNDRVQRSSTCDAQRAAPREKDLAPRSTTCDAQRAAPRATAWAIRSSTCDLRRTTSGAAGSSLGATIKYLTERRRGLRPGHHDKLPARRRGHRPGHHDQIPAPHNERRREQRPGHHGKLPYKLKRGHWQQLGQGPLHKVVYEFS